MPESVSLIFEGTCITHVEARETMDALLAIPAADIGSIAKTLGRQTYNNYLRCALICLLSDNPLYRIGPDSARRYLQRTLKIPMRVGNVLIHDKISCTFNDTGTTACHRLLRGSVLGRLQQVPPIKARRPLGPFD